MDKMDEMVLVVPRDRLFDNEVLSFQGTLTKGLQVQVIMHNISENYAIMRRGDAEANEAFKQPITYAVIQKGDKIFMYERLSGGGEQKLHHQLSIGVGGHMNFEDLSTFDEILGANLEREVFDEELLIDTKGVPFKREILGFVNDDSDNNSGVGKVHIGILILITLPDNATITVRETKQLSGKLVSLEELNNHYDSLEAWSKLVVDNFGDR